MLVHRFSAPIARIQLLVANEKWLSQQRTRVDGKSRIEQVAIEAHELCLLAPSGSGVRGGIGGQLVLDRQLEQYTEQYAINCVEPGPYRFVNELELVTIEPSGDGELRVRRSGLTSLSIS